jgi:dephospho-CoA kinase
MEAKVNMPLIWITGISGSGKSAVRRELRDRGFRALGTDEDGLAHWIDTETGDVTRQTTVGVNQRTPEFHARHDWRVDIQSVRRLAKDAGLDLVFLCGAVQNEAAAWDFFDKAILLSVDEETIRQRISARTENDFGKSDLELEFILGWNRDIENAYAGYGATIVDARQPLRDVVEDILEITNEWTHG